MNIEVLILRLVHVLGGVFWVGSMLFMVSFLTPTLARLGPVAGRVMAGLQERRHLTILPSLAVLTVLSGLRLMWLASGGSPAYFTSPPGAILTAGALATIVALLMALFISRPAMMRAGRLAKELTTDAAAAQMLQELRRFNGRVNAGVATLLVFAAAAMAVARYAV